MRATEDLHPNGYFDFIEVDGIDGLKMEREAGRRDVRILMIWAASFLTLALAAVFAWWPR